MALAELEREAETMFTAEQGAHSVRGHRHHARDTDDLNFLASIREYVKQAVAWVEMGRRLTVDELAIAGVGTADLSQVFEIPWQVGNASEAYIDRNQDIAKAILAIRAARALLARVDGNLSAPTKAPYRV